MCRRLVIHKTSASVRWPVDVLRYRRVTPRHKDTVAAFTEGLVRHSPLIARQINQHFQLSYCRHAVYALVMLFLLYRGQFLIKISSAINHGKKMIVWAVFFTKHCLTILSCINERPRRE